MIKIDKAEKVRFYVDGNELPGLVMFGETVVEISTIEVPEFMKIRVITSGIEKIPVIDLTFKLSPSTNTRKILNDWFYNKEQHDVTKVRTDAVGTELSRTLYPGCELNKYQEPAFDAANPTYYQTQTRLVPWDVIPVA